MDTLSDLPTLAISVADLARTSGAWVRMTLATSQLAAGPAQTKSSPSDLVTLIDRQVEQALIQGLKAIAPEAGVHGEETGASGPEGLTWIIDPIDGTTNLVHGVNHSAIAIALVEDGQPLLGIVHHIFTGQTAIATRGGGARLRGEGSSESQLIHVSGQPKLSGSLLSFGLPYDHAKAPRIFAAAQRVFPHVHGLLRTGSAALDIVSVARGATEAHFELDLRPWDVTAAGLILTEAGGALAGWGGQPLAWSEHDQQDIVASNGLIAPELIAQLAGE